MNRRSFIQQGGAAATGALLAGSARTRRVEANDQIIMAVVGIHGQGQSHFASVRLASIGSFVLLSASRSHQTEFRY